MAETKRKRTPPYKGVSRSTTVESAVSDAFAEFQALRDEMQETRDNMSANNMEALPKYQMADEAASTLEGFADNEPECPDGAGELAVTFTEMVPTRKGRGTSRAVRLDNAVALLDGVVGALEERISEVEDEITGEENEADRKDREADDARGEAEEARLPSEGVPVDEDTASDYDSDADNAEREAEAARERASDLETLKSNLEEFKDEIENVKSEAEGGVEFPGMFG